LAYNSYRNPSRFGGLSRVEEAMKNDVTFVLILVAFFSLAALFVFACDRIIGPDQAELSEGMASEPQPKEPEQLAA
jgi:hypothetical protein